MHAPDRAFCAPVACPGLLSSGGDRVTEVEHKWGVLAVRADEGALIDELPTSGPAAMSLPEVSGPAEKLEPRSDGFASARLDHVAARALEIGLHRIQVLAWRDFE